MRSSAALVVAALALCACPPPHHEVPDAGPDTSCGLDCAAQAEFGLIIHRCFEFSSSPTTPESPQLFSIYVNGLFTLEGNVKTINVQYRSSGQTPGEDFFTLDNGTLTLARRISSNSSATYLQNGTVNGVQWLPSGTIAGAQIDTTRDERLSTGTTTAGVDYSVTTLEASANQLKTANPGIDTDGGYAIIFADTPAGKSDTQRVFVPHLGFTQVTPSATIIAGGQPYYLQNIRDIDVDAGAGNYLPCSLGDVP